MKFRHILFAAILTLLLPSLAHSQGARYDDFAQIARSNSTFVQVFSGAQIDVCSAGATGLPCSPHTTIYSDAALSVPIVQPFFTDTKGNFGFYAPAATTYVITVTGAGAAGYTKTWVAPFVNSGTIPGTQTFTGNVTFSGSTISFSGTTVSIAPSGSLFLTPTGGGLITGTWGGGPTWTAIHTFSGGISVTGGILSTLNVRSQTANPATTGFLNLAATDVISWRNQGNGADLPLSKNSNDWLAWQANPIPNLFGVPINLTGQVANIAATTIYTTSSTTYGGAGMYRVCAVAWTTSTGNSTVTLNAIAPSGAGTVTFPLPQTLNTAALTNPGGGCVMLHAAQSVAIQLSVTGYNTTGTFSIQAVVEQVF